MTERGHADLKRLFHLAIAAPRTERAAVLERECSDDPDLRRRIEAMIAAAEDEHFLASPTAGGRSLPGSAKPDPLGEGALREGPGTRIGPYNLLQQIGEGGFGAVFMAEQEQPVRRKVALKIIKLGMDTRQVVARFEQERQALAMMDHPHIARVIDAGATDTGRPYFVMELVAGVPIAQYCDENHLPIEARLDLFAQVCNAVQHAHTKGIIHRDLKPSNILVHTQDGRPSAKVIDFGIAKATSQKLTDKTLATELHQVIGTFQYMSPEQAEGSLDIDTRTDVYALGVVLYELLTGSTPFAAETLRDAFYSEVQRMIREVEPPRPSTRIGQSSDTIASIAAHRKVEPKRLGALVRGDLDWIVMKALEKDRARRYETADGLAADIRRYLGGDAVVAAPPSAAYRFKKFVRKNRVAVGAGSAVALALLVGVIAFAWQAEIARDQRDRAVTAEAETQERADELQQVSEFQARMLGQIDPTDAGVKLAESIREKHERAMAESGVPESDRLVQGQSFAQELSRVNATDTAVAIIDGTILSPAVQAIDEKFADQPLVAAKLRQSLATLYTKLGLYDKALPLQESALGARRQLLGAAHADTLRSMTDMAVLLGGRGKHAEAEPYFREALDGHRRLHGGEHADTAASMGNLGDNLRTQGRFAEAEPLLRDALALSRRVKGEEDRETLIRLNVVGFLLVDQGKLSAAEPLWRESYETGRRVLGADDRDALVWTNNLGGLLNALGRAAEAEKYYREAYEGTRRVRGEEHPGTLTCASNVASVLQALGRYAEAEPIVRRTLEIRRRTLGEDHPDAVSSLKNLGLLLKYQGKLAEAEPYLRTARDVTGRVLGSDHPDALVNSTLLADLWAHMGKHAEAEALYREVLETSGPVWSEDHPDRLIVMNNFGNLLLQMDRPGEAESLLRGALDRRRHVSGDEHPETLITQSCLARALEDQGSPAEAEAMYRDATEKFRRVLGDDHPNTLNSITNVGAVLVSQGRFAEAEPLLREAVAGYERKLGEGHPRFGGARRMLGRALVGLSRFAEAEAELLAAERVLTTAQGVAPDRLKACGESLVALYEAWEKAEPGHGRDAEAARWRERVR